MRNFLLFSLLLGVTFSFVIVNFIDFQDDFQLLLDNSGPYIGVEFPKQLGFTGDGIKIGVIDTGINLNHPDFFNQDDIPRFSKGYDFVDGDDLDQAEFIKSSLNFFDENESQIEFFTISRLFDKPKGTCVSQDIEKISGSTFSSNSFRLERVDEYMCNSGLIDKNEKQRT